MFTNPAVAAAVLSTWLRISQLRARFDLIFECSMVLAHFGVWLIGPDTGGETPESAAAGLRAAAAAARRSAVQCSKSGNRAMTNN